VAGLLGALQAIATCTGSDTNSREGDDSLEISAVGLGTGSTDICTGVNGRVTKSAGIETGANILGTGVACIWTNANAACKGNCVIGLRTSARGLKTDAKGLNTGVACIGTGMMGMRAGANCMSAGASCIEAGTAVTLTNAMGKGMGTNVLCTGAADKWSI
jgi:hypothetical protein